MNSSPADSLDVLIADMNGLYLAHVQAIKDFSGSRLNALFAIYVLPLLCLGALVASPNSSALPDLFSPFSFPAAISIVFVGTSLIGLCVTRMWVASYLLGQWYSRAINVLRGIYIPMLKKCTPVVEIDSWLPTTSALPSESAGRFVVLLGAAFCGISGLYGSLGICGFFSGCRTHPSCGYTVVMMTVLLSLVAGHKWYATLIGDAVPRRAQP